MSLKLTDKLTAQQVIILKKLEYYGTYNLTVNQAGKLITELFEQRTQENNWTYGDMPEELKWLQGENRI